MKSALTEHFDPEGGRTGKYYQFTDEEGQMTFEEFEGRAFMSLTGRMPSFVDWDDEVIAVGTSIFNGVNYDFNGDWEIAGINVLELLTEAEQTQQSEVFRDDLEEMKDRSQTITIFVGKAKNGPVVSVVSGSKLGPFECVQDPTSEHEVYLWASELPGLKSNIEVTVTDKFIGVGIFDNAGFKTSRRVSTKIDIERFNKAREVGVKNTNQALALMCEAFPY